MVCAYISVLKIRYPKTMTSYFSRFWGLTEQFFCFIWWELGSLTWLHWPGSWSGLKGSRGLHCYVRNLGAEEQHVSIGMGGTAGNHPWRQASTSDKDHIGLRHCGYTVIPSLTGRELTRHGWWHSRDHWHSPSPTSELTLLPLCKWGRAANIERREKRPEMSSIQANSRNFMEFEFWIQRLR